MKFSPRSNFSRYGGPHLRVYPDSVFSFSTIELAPNLELCPYLVLRCRKEKRETPSFFGTTCVGMLKNELSPPRVKQRKMKPHSCLLRGWSRTKHAPQAAVKTAWDGEDPSGEQLSFHFLFFPNKHRTGTEQARISRKCKISIYFQ